MPLSGSVSEPVSVIDAALDQASDPPDTPGAAGAVRSMFAVDPAVTAVQAEAVPRLSTLRNSTIVTPSAPTVTDGPADGADHVAPPSVELLDS